MPCCVLSNSQSKQLGHTPTVGHTRKQQLDVLPVVTTTVQSVLKGLKGAPVLHKASSAIASPDRSA